MNIRFAVIGTSKITRQFLAAAMQDERFSLHAIYSRKLSSAIEFSQDFPALEVFDDLTLLAECENVDAVYIASPNSCHAKQAILMMKNGKHVLCEKPVAVTSEELNLMVATAKKYNVCLMEAMLSTFLPNFLQVQKACTQIGVLRKFTASFCQYSSRYPKYLKGENTNTFNLEFANGSLVDIGIYPLYVAISLFGKPDNAQSQCNKLSSGVDGCGDILLSYKDAFQLQAVISHSKVSSGENIGEVQGELGRVVWHHSSLFNEVKIIFNTGEEQELTLPQNENRMAYECRHFFDLLAQNTNESPINTWQLSADVLKTLESVRKQQNIIYPNDLL